MLVRRILNFPFVYEFYRTIIGGNARSRILVNEYIHPEKRDRVLDIGCGPGNIVPFLPDCEYTGIDASQSYIDSATARFGRRAKFICHPVSSGLAEIVGQADIALAFGILHHLNDQESCELLSLAASVLRPGGKLVTLDGCWTDGQSRATRYLLKKDRGQFVRTVPEYVNLASNFFGTIRTSIRHDLLRIPYTHLILECIR